MAEGLRSPGFELRLAGAGLFGGNRPKLLYAGVGGLTGLLAYGLTLGSKDTATEIWVPSIGGDYVLTSDMVRGHQKFHFSGVTDPNL